MSDGVRGDRVKELRTLRGWTQADLARETGVAQSTLSRIERGHSAGSYASTVHVLAKALRCSESYLVGDGQGELQVVPDADAAPTLAGKPDAEDIARDVIASGRVRPEIVRMVLASGSMQSLNMPLTPAALEALATVVQSHAERRSR